MKNADMPAMPVFCTNSDETIYGLTKREMFAMHAMQGLCSADAETVGVYIKATGGDDLSKIFAEIATGYADALLAELDK